MYSMKRIGLHCLVATSLCATTALAGPSNLSELSALSVVTAPIAVSEAVTTLSVQGVRASGKMVELSVKGAGKVSEFSVRVPAAMVGGLPIAAGTLIEVSGDGLGQLLKIGGKLIGYIPNEIGKSLIHHAPIPGGSPEGPAPGADAPRLNQGRSL